MVVDLAASAGSDIQIWSNDLGLRAFEDGLQCNILFNAEILYFYFPYLKYIR